MKNATVPTYAEAAAAASKGKQAALRCSERKWWAMFKEAASDGDYFDSECSWSCALCFKYIHKGCKNCPLRRGSVSCGENELWEELGDANQALKTLNAIRLAQGKAELTLEQAKKRAGVE